MSHQNICEYIFCSGPWKHFTKWIHQHWNKEKNYMLQYAMYMVYCQICWSIHDLFWRNSLTLFSIFTSIFSFKKELLLKTVFSLLQLLLRKVTPGTYVFMLSDFFLKYYYALFASYLFGITILPLLQRNMRTSCADFFRLL